MLKDSAGNTIDNPSGLKSRDINNRSLINTNMSRESELKEPSYESLKKDSTFGKGTRSPDETEEEKALRKRES